MAGNYNTCLIVAHVVVPSPLTTVSGVQDWELPSPQAQQYRSVTSQPQLQPLTTESLVLPSARVADGHRPDIRRKGRGPTRDTFVDVRLFHPNYPSYLSTAVPAIKHFEREKKLQYVQRVREVEIGSFTPIVFFSPREMGAEAQTFFRRVAG